MTESVPDIIERLKRAKPPTNGRKQQSARLSWITGWHAGVLYARKELEQLESESATMTIAARRSASIPVSSTILARASTKVDAE